jgi:hypothetical protein
VTPSPEYREPRTGFGLLAVLGRYVAALEALTGLDTSLEPVPIERRATGIEIIPGPVSLEALGRTELGTHTLYTASMAHTIVLVGRGAGEVFVAEALEAGLHLEIALSQPVNVELGEARFASLKATPSGAGKFFESDEEGTRDYVFERTWNGELRFPLVIPAVSIPNVP